MSYSMSGWASDAANPQTATPTWRSIAAKASGLFEQVGKDRAYFQLQPLQSVHVLQKFANKYLEGYQIPTDGDAGRQNLRTLCAALSLLFTRAELATLQTSNAGGAFCPNLTESEARKWLEPYKVLPAQKASSTPKEPKANQPKRLYCTPNPGTCFEAPGYRDTVRTQLQFKEPSPGLRPGDRCPQTTVINHTNLHMYRHVDTKNLPICGGNKPSPPALPPVAVVQELNEATPQPVDMGGDIFQYTNLYWGQGPDDQVAALVRNHINPALRKSGYQPLSEQTNFNMSVCAAIKTQFGDMVFAKFKCPYGIPNPHQFLRKATMGIGSNAIPFCKPRENMCFDSHQEKDTAQTQCQFKVPVDRGTKSCIIQGRFMYNNQNQYDPCEIASYPICPETAAQARARILAAREQTPQVIQQPTVDYYPSEAEASQVLQTANEYQGSTNHDPYQPPAPNYGGGTIYDDPTPVPDDPAQILQRDNVTNTIYDDPEPEIVFVPAAEEEEPKKEEESSSKMMYGILAAVVLGGGAVYLMTRKKGKKRK